MVAKRTAVLVKQNDLSKIPPSQELPEIVKYWALRIVCELDNRRHFLKLDGFEDDHLAIKLGLGRFVLDQPIEEDDDDEDFDLPGDEDDEFAAVTSQRHKAKKFKFDFEGANNYIDKLYNKVKRTPHEVPPILVKNVERIARQIDLSETECRLFEFFVLGFTHLPDKILKVSRRLSGMYAIADFLGNTLSLPVSEVASVLNAKGKLFKSGLFSIESPGWNETIKETIKMINDALPERLCASLAEPSDWLAGTISAATPAKLTWDDYQHLNEPIALMRRYVHQSLATQRKGVNIFLYGPPGTGKTELAKLLAQDAQCELLNICTDDQNNEPIGSRRRVQAHCAVNTFFAKDKTLVLFDEVEEVFAADALSHRSADQWAFLPSKHRSETSKSKSWLNQILENNVLPTVWIANSLNGFDPSYARRFDMVLEIPVPPKSHRARILKQIGGELLSTDAITRLSESEHLAPAVVAKAVDVVSSMAAGLPTNASDAVHLLINNTLQAQQHPVVLRHGVSALPPVYEPAFICADTNLQVVTQQVIQNKSARICLYGAPGTGKTAYGRWLAEQMDAPLHVKRASDLLGMYVGQSEKNIASAFEQAQLDGAVLLIDEVDSFLQDRSEARHSWQVSQVNEMLTQMEAFQGVFIASTNLMGQLDPAVLRRFDLKVKFDYMNSEQVCALLCRYCEVQGLTSPTRKELQAVSALNNLTPGDFAAVLRQSRLACLSSASEWVAALTQESKLKVGGRAVSGIGFLG
jgi:SpoVK/Ycf46/Vps4 family AAA+-type ATPase